MAGQPVVPRLHSNPPLLVMQGSADVVNPPSNSVAVYDQAAPPRFLLTLIGAPHLPPFSGPSEWSATVEAVSVDFLNIYLAGLPPSGKGMAAEGDVAGISSLR
jgi:pimeloyl-ACP methyl ester carboxylesterase